jgi:glycosyltransferase involved in cell wall biosynthesis
MDELPITWGSDPPTADRTMPACSVPPRLGIVIGQLDRAGSESQAVMLAAGLGRMNWQVELFSFRNGPLSEEIARQGLRCAVAADTWRSLTDYWFWLKRFNPHIVYTFTFRAHAWGRLLARLRRVPVLVAAYRSSRTYWFDRWTLRWNQAVICNSDNCKALVTRRYGLNPRWVGVVPNGLSERWFEPAVINADCLRKADAPVIIMVARLHRHKDHVTALKGFKRVTQVRPARLVLVGDGPERTRLSQLSQKLGLADRVHFLGHIADVARLLPLANLGWLTSRMEGLPNAVLEYMATGLPVVASRVGGLPEMFEHGRDIMLFEPGDYRTLAAMTLLMLKDRSRAGQIASCARRKVAQKFSCGAATGDTSSILARLLVPGQAQGRLTNLDTG